LVQVKKAEIREAILDNAFELFTTNGYNGTTLSSIAEMSGITSGNVYRYFESKLDLFFQLFSTWSRAHMSRLKVKVQKIPDPRQRLMLILLTLWREIPTADGGFNNCLIEALSASKLEKGYTRKLLVEMEHGIADLIFQCLPADKKRNIDVNVLTHLLFMASDGFAMNAKFSSSPHSVETVATFVCNILLEPQLPTAKST
jgi:AcrR family transcriptional regulator